MCLSLGQLVKIISSPPSRTLGVTSVLFYIKVKVAVISDNICCQVKIDSTFTAVNRFVFSNEMFFTIEFITYLLA